CDPRDVAVCGVNETQRPENKDRRYDKKCTGHDAAPGFVKKPADVDGELLCFRAGQEHAKVKRVQKSRLADPPFLFDQLSLHNRDLAGRSTKRDKPEFQPKSKRFAKRRSTMSTCHAVAAGRSRVLPLALSRLVHTRRRNA